MQRPRYTSLTLLFVLILTSAACTGFLVGRTVKMQQEGKLEEIQQVGEQMIDVGYALERGLTVVKDVILR